MKNMTLKTVATACGGKLYFEELADNITQEASQVIIDSRQIEKNGIFIATVGERVDGHSFIPAVFEAGALGVVCEKLPENPTGACILVDNSFQALKDIATFYRQQLDIKVVGITGSVGKTSTKEFLASVLSVGFDIWKTQGNFNNEVGVPLTILQVRKNHKVLVLEMGINHFGEMTRLSAIGKPDIVVITNIGECHLEYLENRDGVLKAKTEIFSGMNTSGEVILNGDDDKLITVKEVNGKASIFFGSNSENDYYVESEKSHGLFGSEAVLVSKKGMRVNANIPLPGKHMVSNALTAMAVGEIMGLSVSQIEEGISKVASTKGRSNIEKSDKYTIIDDCYNANPTSMKSAIELLKEADTSKVAILGDMFELGEREKELHGEVGAYAATSGIDVLICIGRLSKNMYEAASEKQEAMTYYFEDIESALNSLDNILQTGDSILVKASNSMGFNRIVEYLKK